MEWLIPRWTVAALLAGAAMRAGAQSPLPPDSASTPDDVPAQLEMVAEEATVEEAETLAEELAALRDEPLDVNAAGVAELSLVPGVGPAVAGAIVARRRDYGAFETLDALVAASLLTSAALDVARAYLFVGRPESARASERPARLRLVVTQRLQARLDVPRGYRGNDSTRAYPGVPARMYSRVQLRYTGLTVNVTAEKDPGEAFAGAMGYDHVSASAGVSRFGRLEALVVGDFVAGFGHGLVLARGAGMGKGSDPTRGPARGQRGIQSYGSADEIRYLRGAGATLAVARWLTASAFVSRRRLDATLAAPDSLDIVAGEVPPGAELVATSLSADGLHRTPAELARRGALRESVAGGALEVRAVVRGVDLHVGTVGYRSRFDAPVIPAPRPDTRYGFRGDVAGAVGLFADARRGGYHAFGELARDARGATAAIAGAGATLAPGSEVLLVARRYPREYLALHGAPFGERGAGQNEEGAYLGARVGTDRWTVSGFADVYRFPWLRFNVRRPTSGHEWFLLVEYRPARWMRAHVQARGEARETGGEAAGSAPGSVVPGLERERRRTVRVNGEYDANRSLRLRARVEVTRAGAGATSTAGALVFQDVRYSPRQWLRIDARITLFQTDDFASRLYQLETDVAGAMTLPVLQGRGTRAYVALTLRPVEQLTIQGRVAATFFEDTTAIGSGPDEIRGARAGDASVQVRWAW